MLRKVLKCFRLEKGYDRGFFQVVVLTEIKAVTVAFSPGRSLCSFM